MKLLPLLATAAAVASPALASLNLDIDLSISLDALTNSTLLAQALEMPFDYVVVGGGNSGLAVASRLAEASKRVLVLEAGSHQVGNIEVTIPAEAGSPFKTALDWQYFTEPQGKGFYQALRALGVPAAKDLTNGADIGVAYAASAINPTTHTRVTSEAYVSLLALPNLVVATSCHVKKVNWAPAHSKGDVVATGVTFVVDGTGIELVANARSEVIVSSGSIGTPHLLELSGVGNPAILEPLGIETVVDLPGVGENLQDHPAVVNVYKLKAGVPSLDTVQAAYGPAYLTNTASDLALYAVGEGILTQELYTLAYLAKSNFLSTSEQTTLRNLLKAPNTGISAKQRAAQIALVEGEAPIVEFLSINVYFGANEADANTTYLSLATALQHTFSRGSIHITSTNASVYPAIDPAYLQHPADGFLLSKAAQFVRKAAETSQLGQFIESEVEPGPLVKSDAQWEDWVRGDIRTEYHPISTAAMLPRKDGGVVSPELKVYGTSNVRVVDESIMPIHLSAHAMSVAYAIAEKAADLILNH